MLTAVNLWTIRKRGVLLTLTLLTLSLLALFTLINGEVASANIEANKSAACEAIGGCDDGDTEAVSGILRQAINVLSWLVGVVSIIMIIVGGFRFIISSGDPAGAKSARNTVIYALVGLAVAALAQVLVRFVLTQTRNV